MKTSFSIAAGAACVALAAAGVWLATRESEPRSPALGTTAVVSELPAAGEGAAGLAEAAAGESGAAPAAREALAPGEARSGPAPASPLPAPLVEARVVDPEGLPIADALATEIALRGVLELGRSGADGRLRLELAPVERETPLELVLTHARHARKRLVLRVQPGARIELGELVLVPAGELRGWVEDAFGRRVSGAQVIAAGLENPRTDPEELRRLGPRRTAETLHVESGPDGGFRIEGVPAGPARVWAGPPAGSSAAGGTGFSWSSIGPLEVPAGGSLGDLRLSLSELREGDVIAGIVLDPEGTPVPGAEVAYWFVTDSYGTGSNVACDSSGRFEILLQGRVAHDLTVSDPENRWSELYAFAVEPGTRGLELVFEPARWIDVRVADGAGRALERFELELRSAVEGNWLKMEVRREETGPGAARLRVPGASFRVAATAEGHELELAGPFDPAAPPAELAFALEALPGVRGRVLTSSGQPAAGARVALHRMLARKISLERDGFRLVMEPYGDFRTTTDGEGRFVLYPRVEEESDFVAAEFVLAAEAEGHARTELASRRYDARAGVELELTLVQGGAIEGELLVPEGPEGIDPAGTVLAFSRGDGEIRTLRVGADGRYLLEGLTPGPWEVRVLEETISPEGTTTRSSFVEQGAPPIEWSCQVQDGEVTRHDVELSGIASCAVQGRLELAGRDVAGWTASLERSPSPPGSVGRAVSRSADSSLASVARGAQLSTLLAADGSFELLAPRAGSYTLVLRGPEEAHGRLEFSERLDLSPGRRAWGLSLAPGRLEGSGALDRGTRERFFRYVWTSELPGRELEAGVRIVPDAEGRFLLSTVPDGRGRIQRVDPPAQGQAFAEPETVSEFVLAPGGSERVALP